MTRQPPFSEPPSRDEAAPSPSDAGAQSASQPSRPKEARAYDEVGRPAASSLHDEAVSEVVGYILILALVFLAIGVVYGIGLPALTSAQDNDYLRNVEQTMRVLYLNANRIATGSAPSQAVEVRLKDSSLGVFGKSTFNVTFRNASDGLVNDFSSLSLLTVEHEFNERKTAYEGGALWRQEFNSTGMLLPPLFTINNTTVLPLVLISGSNASTSGTGIARVILENTEQVEGSAALDVTGYTNVTFLKFNITSDYCPGWKFYLNTSLALPIEESRDCSGDNTLVVNASAKVPGNITLYVTQTKLTGEIQ